MAADDDERLRDGARGMLLLLSGERLRKLVASMAEAVRESTTADAYAANVNAGRFVHLYGEGNSSRCGNVSQKEAGPFYNPSYAEVQARPDICPDCVQKQREWLDAREAHRRSIEAKRQATLKRRGSGPYGKKTDKAETFVLEHPEGVSVAEVAQHIRQNERTADSTLRHVRDSRGTVDRRDGRWFPASGEARRPLYQPAILRALADAPEPLTVEDVFARVQKFRPDATLKGIAEEMYRMCETTPPLVEPHGETAHGRLYRLPEGDEATAIH